MIWFEGEDPPQYLKEKHTFYLGICQPQWLPKIDVPVFVSHQRLRGRLKFERARSIWALDSGGFTELSTKGTWTISPEEYACSVRNYEERIGGLQFSAVQDWMCEPHILKNTGKTIRQHQELTIASFHQLSELNPHSTWLPVLQGFELKDYLRHARLYEDAGIDLKRVPVVGVGSICRRQGTKEAEKIITELSTLGFRLHGFGFKTSGLLKVQSKLSSSDSMAWSFGVRRKRPLPGCVTHINCANCIKYALLWRTNLLAKLKMENRYALQSV